MMVRGNPQPNDVAYAPDPLRDQEGHRVPDLAVPPRRPDGGHAHLLVEVRARALDECLPGSRKYPLVAGLAGDRTAPCIVAWDADMVKKY